MSYSAGNFFILKYVNCLMSFVQQSMLISHPPTYPLSCPPTSLLPNQPSHLPIDRPTLPASDQPAHRPTAHHPVGISRLCIQLSLWRRRSILLIN